MTIAAPAKLNLHLAVLDTRPDGFHNLESLFTVIDFEDFLHFEEKPGQSYPLKLIIEGSRAGDLNIPQEGNIIFKAFSLFNQKCQSIGNDGFSTGLQIRLEKKIPVGGGLGGGSSNAASALLALNKLAGCPLETADLLELGASLGSDVPFFLHQTAAAWVTGRGEYIEPLDLPPWRFVLVNPGFKSDTGRAYRLLDEFRGQGSGVREQGTVHLSGSLSFLYQSNSTQYLFYNDFLPVFSEPEKSTYNRIFSQLRGYGAETASLSGAGSTCFGVFSNKEQADKAAQSLKNDWPFVQACSVKKIK